MCAAMLARPPGQAPDVARPPRPPPPNPKADPDRCIKVSHEGRAKLYDYNGQYLLHHSGTGEFHAYPKGSQPTLHFAGKYAYVSEGDATVWVNSIFKKSLWQDQGCSQLFVFESFPDGWRSRWLVDIQKEHATRKVEWSVAPGEAVTLSYIACQVPVNGCILFWDLQRLVTSLDPKRDMDCVSKKLRDSWAPLLNHFGVKTDKNGHILYGRKCRQSEEANAGPSRLESSAISSAALIFLLLMWHKKGSDKQKPLAKALLTNLLSECCSDSLKLDFAVRPEVKPNFDVNVQSDFAMKASGPDHAVDLSELLASKLWNCRVVKSVRKDFPIAFRDSKSVSLVDLLSALAFKDKFAWLFTQLVFCIAKHIDTRWQLLPNSEDVLDVDNIAFHARKDPVVRQSFAKAHLALGRKRKLPDTECDSHGDHPGLEGRRSRAKRASAVSATAAHMDDIKEEGQRYLVSCIEDMSDAKQVGYCNDGSRLGGKNRLHGAQMNLNTGVSCWPPTQALHGYSSNFIVSNFVGVPSMLIASSRLLPHRSLLSMASENCFHQHYQS